VWASLLRLLLPQFQRMQALDAWLKETNTTLTQLNGQRKYGGPPEVWDGPPPGKCCEVFISHIPRDVYEDLLIPLFRSVGPLWEFRLMMNFSGQNRGFAYAKYGTNALAMKAIQKLNGYMIEPNCYLCVRYSIEKRHLSIHNLPSSTSVQNLQEVLVEGVERVSLKTGPGIDGVSAVVGFSSHFTASMAKKVLAAGDFRGTVMVLPGPNCRATIDEARRAIAQQLLLKMPNSHLAA
uniref:DND microRNA-mediated repression inhibitor 1 n=1 Tax=Cyprinodon variegatus TaxID=28743 RepID=A0A3Q2DM21_CYPVA